LLLTLAIFIIVRIVTIFPFNINSGFHVGRTLTNAVQLITASWLALCVAFALARMLPRVILGEDMDAGLFGNGHSLMADMLQILGDRWGNFAAKQIMLLPNYIFMSVAICILLNGHQRIKYASLAPTLMISILLYILNMASEMQSLLFDMSLMLSMMWYVLFLMLSVVICFSQATAAAEWRWPPSAVYRSIQLARKNYFRLSILSLCIQLLVYASQKAENLMLTAVPVIDANWFDWLTTMLQECISGFYLPFEAAILVAAFLQLRRCHDGEKPDDTAAIFD
jgi:hypothetical protein